MSKYLSETSQLRNNSAFNNKSGLLLQKKCNCGQHTVAGSECEECREKKSTFQRKTKIDNESSTVPSIVNETLNERGKPLDDETRHFMEFRFGHDFSQVRVHTNSIANQSAESINANAYTFGTNIVFDKGKYDPNSKTGKSLIAHELTHVLQQFGARNGTFQLFNDDESEKVAGKAERQVNSDSINLMSSFSIGESSPCIQRQFSASTDIEMSPLGASFLGSHTLEGFDTNVFELTQEQRTELASHVETMQRLLRQYPNSFISIAGHTDSVGSEEDNEVLGQNRANAVLNELAALGIPREIMRASSLGETSKVVQTENDEPRNRRVEIFFNARRLPGFDISITPPSPPLGSEPPPEFNPRIENPCNLYPELCDPNRPNPEIFRPLPEVERPRRSIGDAVVGKILEPLDNLTRRLGLTPEIRKRVHDLGERAIEGLAKEALDAGLDAVGVQGETREAIRETIRALPGVEVPR